jgi:tetratricopeptide (TPR) repeat protein
MRAFYRGTFFFILFIFYQNNSYCQLSKVKELYTEGNEYFQAEDYKEAIYYFLQVTEKYNNPNIQYKIGVCYLNMPGEETKAVPYLEEASKHINFKYKMRDITEKQAPLHALFYLGNAYRIDNQLEKALESYNKFINSPGYDGNYNLDIVENEIKACERAKIIQDSPVDVVWEKLPEYVNTPNSDVRPVISGDETVLVFLTSLKLYNAVYFARKMNGQWLAPENINPQILSDGEFYPTALSFDGKELYLVKQGTENKDLYVSYYTDGKWTVAKPLNKYINTSKDEESASISSDGKVLYFSSNRNDSKGGFDIFRSFKDAKGDWGKPENLGKIINTKDDEVSPSISENGKILYFSSKSHYNMGGFDIFYSELGKDNKWGQPVNIGFPINTTNDNIDFKVLGNGQFGYLSKKMNKTSGSDDIYKVEIRSRFLIKEDNKTEK